MKLHKLSVAFFLATAGLALGGCSFHVQSGSSNRPPPRSGGKPAQTSGKPASKSSGKATNNSGGKSAGKATGKPAGGGKAAGATPDPEPPKRTVENDGPKRTGGGENDGPKRTGGNAKKGGAKGMTNRTADGDRKNKGANAGRTTGGAKKKKGGPKIDNKQ